MPIYEFECRECKSIFEELIMNSRERISCKNCGSKDVERILSACGIVSSSRDRGNGGSGSSGSSGCSSCSSRNCSTCR